MRNIRYVGSTRKSLEQRLRQHWSRPAKDLRAWFGELETPPAIFLLDDLDGEDAYTLIGTEYDRIDEWRAAGARLLNTSRRPVWVRDRPPRR